MFTVKPVVPPTRESSKRALFQSPPKEKPKPRIKPEVASRVEKSKRVLFSPHPPSTSKQHRDASVYSSDESQQSHCSSVLTKSEGDSSFQIPSKRKREEEFDGSGTFGNIAKMPRIGSCNMDNLMPHNLKFAKSQSFGHASSTSQMEFSNTNDKSIFRTTSETTIGSSQLSHVHRQVILISFCFPSS